MSKGVQMGGRDNLRRSGWSLGKIEKKEEDVPGRPGEQLVKGADNATKLEVGEMEEDDVLISSWKRLMETVKRLENEMDWDGLDEKDIRKLEMDEKRLGAEVMKKGRKERRN